MGTQFEQLESRIRHDEPVFNEVYNFYKNQKFSYDVREKCAGFIENEDYWQRVAEMKPTHNNLFDELKRFARQDLKLEAQIKDMQAIYQINSELARRMRNCLEYERDLLNKLSEGLLPVATRIDDLLKDCGSLVSELKRQLDEYKLFGATLESTEPLHQLLEGADIASQKLVETVVTWQRLQQLEQFVTEKPPPSLNPIQKECEGLAEFILQYRDFAAQLNLPNQLAIAQGIMDRLLKSSLIIEIQPPQNLKVQKTQKTKDFDMTIRFLLGKTLLNSPKAPAEVEVTFDCEHNLTAEESQIHSHRLNVINNRAPLECACGRLEWCCSAQMKKLQVISFRRCNDKKTSTVAEQKYGAKVTVVIPDDGFGNSYPLQATSLPIVVTTQTSQDWMAAATLFWDNSFAALDRKPYQVPDRVPWSKMSLILSEKFRATVCRGLTSEHLAYLKSKVLLGGGSSQELSWNQFAKNPMDKLGFSFWKWFYAVHNLTKMHLKTAWSQGLVEGFIDKSTVKKMLKRPDIYSGNFMLRFSDSKIEENESSSFGGSLVVCYVKGKTGQSKPEVGFIQPFTPGDFVKDPLGFALCNLEVQPRSSGSYEKSDLQFLYPNRPFQETFDPLLKEEEKAAQAQAKANTDSADEKNEDEDDYKYRPVTIKHVVNGTKTTENSGTLVTQSWSPAMSCATTSEQCLYSRQDLMTTMSPTQMSYRVENPVSPAASDMSAAQFSECPVSPASSFHTAVGSPQQNLGNLDLNGMEYMGPNVMVESLAEGSFDSLTLSTLNYDNSSGQSISALTRYLEGDVDMENEH